MAKAEDAPVLPELNSQGLSVSQQEEPRGGGVADQASPMGAAL